VVCFVLISGDFSSGQTLHENGELDHTLGEQAGRQRDCCDHNNRTQLIERKRDQQYFHSDQHWLCGYGLSETRAMPILKTAAHGWGVQVATNLP